MRIVEAQERRQMTAPCSNGHAKQPPALRDPQPKRPAPHRKNAADRDYSSLFRTLTELLQISTQNGLAGHGMLG
jgi:hypothetical protein